MGNWNSGRRPQPNALKVLRGKRVTNDAEPQLPAADFDAVPDELKDDAIAAAEWSRVVPLLRVSGIITAAEKPVLMALCQQWSIYVAAQQHVREHGMFIGPRVPKVNPRIKVASHALTHCLRLWTELGLTPTSRAKMAATPVGDVPKASRWGSDLT